MREQREIGNCDLIRKIVDYREQFFSKDLEELIRLAYYLGAETEARDHGERVDKLLKEQKERARQCRYHKLGLYIQGNVDYVYSPNYAGDWSADYAERLNLDEFSKKTGAKLVDDEGQGVTV